MLYDGTGVVDGLLNRATAVVQVQYCGETTMHVPVPMECKFSWVEQQGKANVGAYCFRLARRSRMRRTPRSLLLSRGLPIL